MAKIAKKPAPTGSALLELPKFDLRASVITLTGDSPLICHAWSAKAKKEMLDKQMKKAKASAPARDPEQDYLDSLYEHPSGGYGFPAIAFKSAAVDACSHLDGITKVEARGTFHIEGKNNTREDLVKIIGEPRLREDMVRIGMGTAYIRFRGEFPEWSVKIPIRYNAGVLSIEQIVNMFNIAGFAIGVGEWRPQRDGMFGRFHCQEYA